MSKTYRRTHKNQKRDWLPEIYNGRSHRFDLSDDEILWLKNNPHRTKDVNDWYEMTEPSWWNRLFTTRPRRQRERELLHKVKAGKSDADDVAWPLNHKPHKYYW